MRSQPPYPHLAIAPLCISRFPEKVPVLQSGGFIAVAAEHAHHGHVACGGACCKCGRVPAVGIKPGGGFSNLCFALMA